MLICDRLHPKTYLQWLCKNLRTLYSSCRCYRSSFRIKQACNLNVRSLTVICTMILCFTTQDVHLTRYGIHHRLVFPYQLCDLIQILTRAFFLLFHIIIFFSKHGLLPHTNGINHNKNVVIMVKEREREIIVHTYHDRASTVRTRMFIALSYNFSLFTLSYIELKPNARQLTSLANYDETTPIFLGKYVSYVLKSCLHGKLC